jgi:hypothetical protein
MRFVLLMLVIVGTSCTHNEQVAPDPVNSVVIVETTQGRLGDISVGVGNIWERTYRRSDGTEHTGLTAMLFFDEQRVVVGEASVVLIGTQQWRIVRVTKDGNGGRGTVVVVPVEQRQG